MELGIYSFAEISPDPLSGTAISPRQRMADLLEEIELADQAGLDVFAVGEHHRPDFIVSAPAVVLAAAASRTRQIRLSSAVSVLSSDDPVRVFQEFATLDLISGGRAEIMAGRGSFIESFPLFGYDLKDYDELFSEKLDLLLRLNRSEVISWKGKFRPEIYQRGVYPRPFQSTLPIWVAIGGTPASAVRAASLGLPLALAIIGGSPDQFVPLSRLYRSSWEKAGHPINDLQFSINSHTYLADDSQAAAAEFYPSYASMMTRIGQERGWPGLNRQQYEQMRSPRGSLLVGSPQAVIDKILYEHELFKHTRFMAQMSVGAMPHKKILHSIELFATRVAPAIRKALGNSPIT